MEFPAEAGNSIDPYRCSSMFFDVRSESVFLSLNASIRIWYHPSSVSPRYSSLEEALFAVFDRMFLLDNALGYEQKEKSPTLPKANSSMSSSTKQGHPKVTKEG
jgi:hypothetical protein